jgi:hypothetical protein
VPYSTRLFESSSVVHDMVADVWVMLEAPTPEITGFLVSTSNAFSFSPGV